MCHCVSRGRSRVARASHFPLRLDCVYSCVQVLVFPPTSLSAHRPGAPATSLPSLTCPTNTQARFVFRLHPKAEGRDEATERRESKPEVGDEREREKKSRL